MNIYRKIRVIFSKINNKIIRGIHLGKKVKISQNCKFLPSVQVIDETLKTKSVRKKLYHRP